MAVGKWRFIGKLARATPENSRNEGRIRQVGLTDRPFAGLWIPYSNLDGTPVLDAGMDYGRIRLLEPVGKQKYHQRAGSQVHAYLPPGLLEFPLASPVFVIEGDFKALALREAGYLAVGLSGFYGFAREKSTVLAPELAAVLSHFKPTAVHFCGDTDATSNYQFYDAAHKFSALLQKLPKPPQQLFLTCAPVDSQGKGFDDIREALKDRFKELFTALLTSGSPLVGGVSAVATLVERVIREQANFKSLQGAEKEKAQKNLLKAAAACANSDPIRHEEIITFLSETFGIPKPAVRKAVKMARAQLNFGTTATKNKLVTCKLPPHLPLPCDGTTTYTDSAKVLFTLLKLSGNYYRQGGSLVVVNSTGESAKLEPVSPESLRTRAENLNAPLKRATMTLGGPTFAPANMLADEAKVLLASEELKQLNLIRGVLPLPILTLGSDKQPRMLGPGYDPDTQLFVTAKVPLPSLPPVADAVKTINSLFVDFRFQDASDQSRAVAMFLTLALTVAGILPGHNPMFVLEADDSQAGKGLMTSLLANVFRLRIAAVTMRRRLRLLS